MLASLSPPLKQKCFGLRRTTTFRGKLHTELLNVHIQKSKSDETADFGKLEKGSLSLGEIRDQDGSIIGIVHFYKSPKSSCMRRLNSFSYGITRPEASSQRSSSDKPTCKKIYESSNMPKNPQATYTSSQFEETVNLSNCNELDDTNPSPKKFSSLQNSQNSDICQVNDSGFCESDWETDIQSIDPILPVQMVDELESEVKCESLSDGRVVDTLRDVNAESLNSTLQGISLSQGNASAKENRPTISSTEEKLVLVDDLPDISLWNMYRMPHNIMENQDIHGTVEEGGDCGKDVPFAKDQTFLEMYTNKNNSEIQKPVNYFLTNYLADQTSCQSNRNQNISGILGGSNKFCQNLGDNSSKEIEGNKYEQNDNLGLNFVKISPNNSHETIWSSLSMDSLDDAAMKDLKISKSELPKVQDCETRVTDINLKSTEISSTDAYISGIKKELNIHENKEFDFYKKNNQERLPEAEIQLSELSQRGAAEGKPVLTKAFDTSDCSFICGGILQDGDSSKTSIREVQKTYLSCTNKSVANCKNDKVCFLENSGTAGGIWQKVSPHEEIPDKKSVSIFSYIMGHMDSGKVQNDMTPVLASSNTSEYASCSDEDQSNQNDVPLSMWKASEKSETKDNELSLPVPGPVFKMRTELILKWFEEFNDEQKNIVMKKLLNRCGLPQMHLMSVAMEPKLHKTCPPNCQDMLVWLPYPVVLKILMYLDPASLCCCNQVNKAWNKLTNNPLLWQQLTRNPDYRLSETSSRKQYMKYTRQNGDIHWKKVFAERFLLKKNWLNGTYQLRTCKGHEQGIACVQFDDTRIVSGSSDKTIKLWDITGTTPELILTLEGHSGTVRCLDLNGNRLVSGSTDRTIKVWDISFDSFWAGASCKVTMVGHLHTVRCLQADDKKLVSGSYDKTVKVWDLKTGQCQLTLRGHTAAVLCVQFDDQKIVSGSYDKKIKVWDLTEGSCLMTLDGHQDAVTCLNLTHDGMKIITGSLDYSLKFWDLFTGKCYGTLDWIRSEGHTAVVRCLQVDNWRIISGGDDKTLKVWELATGQRLLTLRYHSDGVTCMQFSDFAIVSGSYDRTVKLWDFTPKHPYLEAVT